MITGLYRCTSVSVAPLVVAHIFSCVSCIFHLSDVEYMVTSNPFSNLLQFRYQTLFVGSNHNLILCSLNGTSAVDS